MVPTLQPLAFDGGGKHNIFIGGNKVFGWGLNDFGQLCPKTKRINKSPVRLRVGNPIMAAAGQKHTLYLYADGSIKSCGRNKWGQLGNGTTSDARQLVSVPGINEVVSIADGGHHSLAITADGILYAWGRNKEGQLCDTADGTAVTMPQEVNIGGITEAAAGDHHTLLLRQGQIWACGLDDHGQLGLESVTPPQFPAPIDGLPDVLAVATGGEHSLAVVADSQGNNRLYTWGRNTFGQLCLGDLEDRDIPTPTQITGISKIDGEGPFSAILLEDGRVLTCGWGMFGGANPRDITEGSDIAQVVDMTAGHYTVHIWDNLGRVFGMGGNDYGQVGDGTRRARWNLVKIGTVN